MKLEATIGNIYLKRCCSRKPRVFTRGVSSRMGESQPRSSSTPVPRSFYRPDVTSGSAQFTKRTQSRLNRGPPGGRSETVAKIRDALLHAGMPVRGAGVLVCSSSLLIRGTILPAIRQKLHLAPCADFRCRLCVEAYTVADAELSILKRARCARASSI
jgi:hypothetical protein